MNKTDIHLLMQILVISIFCIASTVNAQHREEKQTNKQTLGLQIQNRLILQGETLRKRRKRAVLVHHVRAYGIGRSMGVSPNDIILMINNTKITDVNTYRQATEKLSSKDKIEILVWRYRNICMLQNQEVMTLGARHSAAIPACAANRDLWKTTKIVPEVEPVEFPYQERIYTPRKLAFGAELENFRRKRSTIWKHKQRRGVTVVAIQRNDAASRLTLKRGDLILAFGQKTISNVRSLNRYVDHLTVAMDFSVTIIRHGRIMELTYKANPYEAQGLRQPIIKDSRKTTLAHR